MIVAVDICPSLAGKADSISARHFAVFKDDSSNISINASDYDSMPWDTGSSDRSEPPKRSKRAQYAARACVQCQTRKIKCEGVVPCRQCSFKGRECSLRNDTNDSLAASQSRHQARPSGATERRVSQRSSASQAGNVAKPRITNNEVYERLISMEKQLNATLAQNAWSVRQTDDDHDTSADFAEPNSPPGCDGDSADGQTFAGEASMLDDDDNHMLAISPVTTNLGRRRRSTASTTVRPPNSHSTREATKVSHSTSWLRDLLFSFGVVPDLLDCKTLLGVFFDEVYIIYPFLHPPAVWQTFECLWSRNLIVSADDLEQLGESKLTVAILFVCVALGRCTASPRTPTLDGAHSAGWSLYKVAVELVRPFLDVTSDSPTSLHSLQVLAIMVVYLVRLDACERAERTLAHAISSAHILGVHRSSFYTNVSAYDEEMFNRLWWCIYVQDRRLSLESSRPFLIQDSNIDIRLPLEVTEAWLERCRQSRARLVDLSAEVEAEKLLARPKVVPYLAGYISQSRVAADVWRAVYNTKQEHSDSTFSMMCQYLDVALNNWWQSLPPKLRYQENSTFDEQFADAEWWQAKQAMLLYMRYCLLMALIRKTPAVRGNGDARSSSERAATDARCAQLAAAIIRVYENIPETRTRQSFPFIHPMTSATMILHGLMSQHHALRQAYGKTLLAGVNALVGYCHKTWVSGKMLRTAFKLNVLAQQTLGHSTERPWQASDSHARAVQHERDGTNGLSSRIAPDTNATSSITHVDTRLQDKGLPSPSASTASAVPSTSSIFPGPHPPLEAGSLWLPVQDSRGEDASMLPVPSNAEGFDLPTWATIDFDFENGGGTSRLDGFAEYLGGEPFGFDGGWAQSLGM